MARSMLLGIDPGFYGAVAWLCRDGTNGSVSPTPLLPRPAKGRAEYDLVAMRALVHPYVSGAGWREVIAVIEEPMAMPLQSCVKTARQFTGYGIWLGLLAGISFYRVRPATWKKALGLHADKATSIALAHELFPMVSLVGTKLSIEGKAEALLLAEYGRRFL